MVSFTEEQLSKDCPDCVEQFRLIRKIINEATFKNVGKLSCHVLCIAVGELFEPKFKIKHGYYTPGLQHSWLIDRHGNIVDLYPWDTISEPILTARTIAGILSGYETPKGDSFMYREDDTLEVLKNSKTREDADIAKAELARLLETHKA